jgi:hypothetical protein
MSFDENKLISLMENFSGAKFQWIKTSRPDLLGKVVTCKNIEPRGDKFFAIFEDGSCVETSQLNTNLLMLHGDMQPLSKIEVDSLHTIKKPQPQSNNNFATNSNLNRENKQVQPAQPISNMFEMFNSNDRDIELKLKISLPDQDFLKMMYNNAKDKQKFLTELSDYVFSAINKKVIQSSISLMVLPKPNSTSNIESSLNITEIHGE